MIQVHKQSCDTHSYLFSLFVAPLEPECVWVYRFLASCNQCKEQRRKIDIADRAVSGVSGGNKGDADWEAQGGHSTKLFSQVPLGLTKDIVMFPDCQPR